MDIPTFKICVTGTYDPDSTLGIGKTSWVKYLDVGVYEKTFVPTLGVEVHRAVFTIAKSSIEANVGRKVRLNLWDCAGQDRFSGLREGYYIKADGAIVGCTLGSLDRLDGCVDSFRQVVGDDVPVVTTLFKADELRDCEIESVLRQSRVTDCQVSLVDGKVNDPITILVRQLLDDNEIEVSNVK